MCTIVNKKTTICVLYSLINFYFVPSLELRAPFGVSVITHTLRHTVGLLWMSVCAV
jgi:hypothetical protein